MLNRRSSFSFFHTLDSGLNFVLDSFNIFLSFFTKEVLNGGPNKEHEHEAKVKIERRKNVCIVILFILVPFYEK